MHTDNLIDDTAFTGCLPPSLLLDLLSNKFFVLVDK